MKNLKIFIIFFISLFVFSCQKDESFIEEPKEPGIVNEMQNLEVLCRVWGLVRYHHPAYSMGGSRDADVDLIELIRNIRSAGKNTRNWLILKWLNDLGKYDSNKQKWDEYVQNWNRNSESSTKPVPKVIANLTWMEDSEVLGNDLSAELVKIRYSVREKRNKYLVSLRKLYKALINNFIYYKLLLNLF